jgi:hypothetical protein
MTRGHEHLRARPSSTLLRRAITLALAALLVAPRLVRAEWVRDENSIAWKVGASTIWRFSFDPKSGKPFFHPVAVGDGPSFTTFKPEDHPWHYGLWFSWKYINHVNYWEENRVSGQSAGSTRWSTPVIDAHPDGSARITMNVTYSPAAGQVDMTETRVLNISAPDASGAYTIDWDMHFTAGAAGAVLDRTPMPGEPNGAFNGGYAGLSARLTAAPVVMSVVTADSAITQFEHDRARPATVAIAGNLTSEGKDIGGIAILSDAANIGERAPWYIIDAPDFHFLCAAVLAPAIRTLTAGGQWSLRYRVAVRGAAWTPATLTDAVVRWRAGR